MFGSLGIPEILFILVIALLIFGPKRLPEMGRTIGKAMGEFRRASSELRRTLNSEIALADDESRPSIERRPAVQRSLEEVPANLPPPAGVAPGSAPRGAQARGTGPGAPMPATEAVADSPESAIGAEAPV